MRQELTREFLEAMEAYCDLLIGIRALNRDDAEVRARLQEAHLRCERAQSALFGAGLE